MGEIFEGVAVTHPLPWTGERCTTQAGPQVEVEHLHRYMFARSLCRGLDVLDIAAGEGFGSFFLAQTARSVIGVDTAADAVHHAEATYRANNLEFRIGDARSIPLPDAAVDAVVSFETIEHFFEHDAFLREIRRVLRPGGKLIISSPDSAVYSPAATDANPFHVRELSRDEFIGILQGSFAHVALAGQRALQGSAIVADRRAGAGLATFERRGSLRFEVSDGLPRCPYLLAVASDAPLDALPDSLFVDADTVAELPGSARASSAAVVELGKVKAVLEEATVYARHLETQIEARARDIKELRAYIATLEARLTP